MITTRLKNIVKNIPQKPGVYLFKDRTGRILYIGKAINLQKRVKSHFRKPKGNNSPLPPLISRGGKNAIANIDWIETEDEDKAFLLENELIKKYHPRYNIQWRDDKSYFWVRFTEDEWPRVQITHKLKTKNSKLKTNLAGPFVNGNELKQLLRALRKILPYRTCKNSYEKPCLQWHLGLCPAHGDKTESGIKNYELWKSKYAKSLMHLSQILRLYAGEPIRIEAFDISNIQGVYATGSMVVFDGAKPKKSDYRRFRVKTVRNANDVAMMKEVLRRRLNHPEWPPPGLMLIDGGRAQLTAAKFQVSSFKLQVPFIALAKKHEEIYTEFSERTLRLNKLPPSLKNIFQAIRDEAHRFAIFYYRHLHGKQFRKNQKRIGNGSAPPPAETKT